jgi:hypothetical protein
MDKSKQMTGRGLRIMSKSSTLEMARRRISWIFDEFDNVMVSVSTAPRPVPCRASGPRRRAPASSA